MFGVWWADQNRNTRIPESVLGGLEQRLVDAQVEVRLDLQSV